MSHSIDFGLLAPHLGELNRTFDQLSLVLLRGTKEETLKSLKSGGAEVALAATDDAEAQVSESFLLFNEEFLFRCSRTHRMVNRAKLSLDDLREERFVLPRHGECLEAIAASLRRAKTALGSCHEVYSDADMLQLVADGFGVTVAPRSAADCEDVVSMPIDGLDLRRTVYVFGIKERPRSPAVSMLINLLRATDWPHSASN